MDFINKFKFVIIVLLICSCNNKNEHNQNIIKIDSSNLNEQITDVPNMFIEYGFGLDTPGLVILIESISPGTAKWSYYNGNDKISFVQDSIHPLDSSIVLPKIINTNKIKISFEYKPSYYTVRYWPENYIGDTSAYEMYFQTINVEDDIIIFPIQNQKGGYVFELKAVWESVNGINGIQGEAYYAFF